LSLSIFENTFLRLFQIPKTRFLLSLADMSKKVYQKFSFQSFEMSSQLHQMIRTVKVEFGSSVFNYQSVTWAIFQLKLIERSCATRWTPPDYWQTDNGLVMVIRSYHSLTSASWVLISTSSAPLAQTGERKHTHIWMDGHYHDKMWQQNEIFHCLTLTYDLDLQSQASQGQGRPSCQKYRSNGSNRRAPTDKRTDTHTWTLPNVLSALLRGR